MLFRSFQAQPAKLEDWVRARLDPGLAPFKDLFGIRSLLLSSLRSVGLFLLLSSTLIGFSQRRPGSTLPGRLLILTLGAELLPANLRLCPLMSEADVDFVPEVNAYIQENGPREPYRVVAPTISSFRPMMDLQLRAPNRSSAWLTLLYRRSGQPFHGIMNGIQYSLNYSVDNLNTNESEELWKEIGRAHV